MKQRLLEELSLDGGCIAFDFVNTVHNRLEEDTFDYLGDYGAFLDWSVYAGVMSSEKADGFRSEMAGRSEDASRAHQMILEARETSFSFFQSLINGKPQDDQTLKRFNGFISRSLANYTFDPDCKCICLTSRKELASPLNLIFTDAYEILRAADHQRIKMCEACGWLFLDTTKNGKRRWCNSLSCGSIDKAKRYYHRKKKAGSARN